MKKRIVKKSEVLKEGYLNGLRRAKRIISEMLAQSQGFDNDFDEFKSGSISGQAGAITKTPKKPTNLKIDNKKEFISIINAILDHTSLEVSNTLACSTVDCGTAYFITSDGVLLDEFDDEVADFSDWYTNEDGEPELGAIDSKSLTLYKDGQAYKLTSTHDDFDLIKFLLFNNRKWKH